MSESVYALGSAATSSAVLGAKRCSRLHGFLARDNVGSLEDVGPLKSMIHGGSWRQLAVTMVYHGSKSRSIDGSFLAD